MSRYIDADIEKQPTIELCEDAISREWIKENMLKYGFLAPDMTVTEFVEDAPSVAPKHSGEVTEMVEDAISIEVAIQTTWMILNGMGYLKDQNEELDQTIKAVFNTAPRVAPSRPSGEWTDLGKGIFHYECSNCSEHSIQDYGYCPNCGARMKGADDE